MKYIQSVNMCIDTDGIRRSDFRLNLIFAITPTAHKNVAHFKSGQKWIKNNHLTPFTKVKSKSLIHTVLIVGKTKEI